MRERSNRDHLYTSFSEAKDFSLPSIPHICGYEDAFAEEAYNVHGLRKGMRRRFMVQYTLAGCGQLEKNGQKYSLPPESALLLEIPGDWRYIIHPESERWEILFAAFQDEVSLQLGHALIREHGNVVSIPVDADAVSELQRLYEALKGANAGDPFLISRIGYDFLISLRHGLTQAKTVTRGHIPLLTLIRAFCMKHLERKISVDDLARHCGFTRSYFSTLFRRETGISPGEFILHFKLNIAENILSSERSSIPIKEIAAQCGFEDHSYFCRVFRKHFGISPGRYLREQEKHDSAANPSSSVLLKKSSSGMRKKTSF